MLQICVPISGIRYCSVRGEHTAGVLGQSRSNSTGSEVVFETTQLLPSHKETPFQFAHTTNSDPVIHHGPR